MKTLDGTPYSARPRLLRTAECPHPRSSRAGGQSPLRVIRYRGSGRSSHVRADAESGNQLSMLEATLRAVRGVPASFARVKAQFGNATVGAAEAPAKFAVDILHHDHIGVDVGLVVRVEVSGRELVQHGCGLRDHGG